MLDNVVFPDICTTYYTYFTILRWIKNCRALTCNLKVLALTNSFLPIPDLECGLPAPIRNGGYYFVNETRHYLSVVRYECKPGYTLVGRAELVCDIDERWNGPPPRCERKCWWRSLREERVSSSSVGVHPILMFILFQP